MKYQPPFDPNLAEAVNGIHNTDPDASYANGNPATGSEGSIPPAEAFEHPLREIAQVITFSNLTPSHADLTQLRQAIKRIAGWLDVEANVGGGAAIYRDNKDSDGNTDYVRKLRSIVGRGGIECYVEGDKIVIDGKQSADGIGVGGGVSGGGGGIGAATITAERYGTYIFAHQAPTAWASMTAHSGGDRTKLHDGDTSKTIAEGVTFTENDMFVHAMEFSAAVELSTITVHPSSDGGHSSGWQYGSGLPLHADNWPYGTCGVWASNSTTAAPVLVSTSITGAGGNTQPYTFQVNTGGTLYKYYWITFNAVGGNPGSGPNYVAQIALT